MYKLIMQTPQNGAEFQKIEDFLPAAERMATFIKENEFNAILVNGASAQTGAYMVKQAWKRKYPSTPMPKFFATGSVQKEFYSDATLHPLTIYRAQQTSTLSPIQVSQKLKNLLKNIPSTSKIFILEESVIEGGGARRTKMLLQEMGYNKVKIGTLHKSAGQKSKVNLDFIGEVSKTEFPEFYGTRRRKINELLKERALARLSKKTGEIFKKEHTRKELIEMRKRARLIK